MRRGSDPYHMPRKNTIKEYVANGFYHIYNRGIDRREIFLDEQDYSTFLFNLSRYLAPFNIEDRSGFKKDRPSVSKHKLDMNLAGEVDLLAYCLMPNHFHLLARQNNVDGITKVIRRVCVNYAMYFNKKYGRQGGLFESVYKAVLVESEEQLLHVSRYIHLNPVKREVYKIGPVRTTTATNPADYSFSSYKYYVSGNSPDWLNSLLINKITGYKYEQFVMDYSINTEAFCPQLLLDVE